jgi:hypothetical protein
MPDDPSIVPRSAILQSITTEASGFYTTVTTVASTFLGASLLFFDKFVSTRTTSSLVFLALSWVALVAAIASVARVRFLNLRSGQLALQDKFDAAAAIDIQGGRFSTAAQWCLIIGMAALVVVGLMNVSNFNQKDSAVDNPNSTPPQKMEKTIPYGSLRPNTTPAQPPAEAPTPTPASPPPPTSQPKE